MPAGQVQSPPVPPRKKEKKSCQVQSPVPSRKKRKKKKRKSVKHMEHKFQASERHIHGMSDYY
jgi:hypothetical protein